MLSQNISQMLLPKLEIPLCDIFKCTEKNCFSSEVKKYVEAQYYIKDNPFLSNSSLILDKKEKHSCESLVPNSSLNVENTVQPNPVQFRKLEVRLCDILKDSNKKLDFSSFSNESMKSEQNVLCRTKKTDDLEIISDSERSSDIESAYDDEKDEDFICPELKSGSESEAYSKSESSSSRSEIDSESESSSRNKKKKNKKKGKNKKNNETTEESRELTDYEKLIQKSREEKMAFLKSLQIDEIKEDIKKVKKRKLQDKLSRRKINQKGVLPERKSVRTLTLNSINLSEDFITEKAYSEAAQKLKIEAQKIKEKQRRKRRRKYFLGEYAPKNLLKDFLIPALNDERYSPFLKWINKRNYQFSIQCTLTNNRIFEDYAKMNGSYKPEVMGYRQKTMECFLEAVSECNFIRRIPVDSKIKKMVKHYELVLEGKKREQNYLNDLKQMICYKCEICGTPYFEKFMYRRHLNQHSMVQPGGTSFQSNAKPEEEELNAKGHVKMEQPLMTKPNTTTSTSTNLTSPLVS